jgi:hypothetical protein
LLILLAVAVAVEMLAALSSKIGNNTFSKFSSSFLLPLLLSNISLLLLKLLSLPIIVANQFALLEGINSKCSDRCIYICPGLSITMSGSKYPDLGRGQKVKPFEQIHLI